VPPGLPPPVRFFAVDSYIAPVTTDVTGLAATTVPWVLVAVGLGLGMTVGNALGSLAPAAFDAA